MGLEPSRWHRILQNSPGRPRSCSVMHYALPNAANEYAGAQNGGPRGCGWAPSVLARCRRLAMAL
jgi:hypothetical protein